MADLSTRYLGIPLKNPIIIGSSGLTDNVKSIVELERSGAGAVVVKSLFEEEIVLEMQQDKNSMTGREYVYPETHDYLDYQEEEDGVRKYLRLITEAKATVSIPIIASINCVSDQKWTYFAKEIEKAGADAIELNLFVLPTDFSRNADFNRQIYFNVIKAVKEEVTIPVSIKLSYYFSDLGPTLMELSETGIYGMVLFNRFYSPDFDIENFSVLSSNVLSSPSDLSISLRWIAIMSQRVSCDLCASTGVHDGKALIKQLLAGTNAVQVVSSVYKNGPEHISLMLSELDDWMEKQNFKSIEDFRGMLSQNKSLNPASYERVQFMKEFRHFAMKIK